MKIFFFGGAFDPPHKAHKLIYKHCIDLCDKFIFFPAKESPGKNLPNSEDKNRFEMLKLLIDKEDFKKVSVDDFELCNNKKSFTIKTIQYLKNKFIGSRLYMVIGYDQYMNLKKWKNYKEILNSVEIICFKRKYDSFNKIFPANIVDFNYDISSTLVRKMIQKNRINLCKNLVNQKVYDYIVDNKLYRN